MPQTPNAPPWAAAKRSVLRVGEGGRGFVAELAPDRIVVITAAHCLPQLPPPLPACYMEERSHAALLGPLGGPLTVWAECVFADPLADVAVLAPPDRQSLLEEYEAYDTLIDDHPALRLAAMPAAAPVWMLALNGRWIQCQAERWGGLTAFAEMITVKGPSAAYAPGTSGSPILAENRHVVGLVGVGDVMNPVLLMALPPRVTGSRRVQ